jgi:hypothetical protein
MSQAFFILLLGVYGIVIAVSLVVPASGQEHIAELKYSEALRSKPRVYTLLLIVATGLIMATGIIGFIGMLFFWHLAPGIFGFAVIGKIALGGELSILHSTSMRDKVLTIAQYVLEASILGLAFFGPARRWFFA